MTDDVSPQAQGGEAGIESTRNVPVFRPPTDIYEVEDELVLLIEMPNVDPSDIDVNIDKRVLTIVGRGRSVAPDGYSLAHVEYRDGDYERSFTLSDNIDADGIEASLKDGVLTLTLPKSKPEPAKQITVKAE